MKNEKFKEYLEKAMNENLQLKPNQVEIVGNNVYGKIQNIDFSKMNAMEFYELIKTKMPSLYRAIEAQGGLEALKGSDDKPDVSVGLDGKIEVNPDGK